MKKNHKRLHFEFKLRKLWLMSRIHEKLINVSVICVKEITYAFPTFFVYLFLFFCTSVIVDDCVLFPGKTKSTFSLTETATFFFFFFSWNKKKVRNLSVYWIVYGEVGDLKVLWLRNHDSQLYVWQNTSNSM